MPPLESISLQSLIWSHRTDMFTQLPSPHWNWSTSQFVLAIVQLLSSELSQQSSSPSQNQSFCKHAVVCLQGTKSLPYKEQSRNAVKWINVLVKRDKGKFNKQGTHLRWLRAGILWCCNRVPFRVRPPDMCANDEGRRKFILKTPRETRIPW